MKINITDVHLDLGASLRGAWHGAQAIHQAGIVTALESLGHDVAASQQVVQREPTTGRRSDSRARFIDIIAELCGELADTVELAAALGHFPLILGGDHSQAIGSIAGLARHFGRRGQELGVLWVDAHADMNTAETSPSGRVHGMPLAALLGHGRSELTGVAGPRPALAPEHVVLFGVRDIDPTEQPLVRASGVRVFTMEEIAARGPGPCLAEAMDRLSAASAGIHLSYDLDSIDPTMAPGVGTPVPGGLTTWDAALICQAVASSGRLASMEIVELNPSLDVTSQTAKLAVWLIRTALSDRLLHDSPVLDACQCGRPLSQAWATRPAGYALTAG